jgi:hypothetical protein
MMGEHLPEPLGWLDIETDWIQLRPITLQPPACCLRFTPVILFAYVHARRMRSQFF